MRDSVKQILRQGVLIENLVAREIKARYRGSLLGFLWSFLNPLLMILVYSLVFSVFLRFDVEHYAIFLFCGLLPWVWFSSSLAEGIPSIVTGSTLLTRVVFHAAVLPTVRVASNLVNFLLSLPLLVIFLVAAGLPLGYSIAAVPILVVLQFLFTLGLVLLLSALNVFYRDVQHLVGNLLTLWFFLCPIIYPLDLIPERYRGLLYLNPMGLLVKGYQDVFYHSRFPQPDTLLVMSAFALCFLAIGFAVFERYRHVFAEEI